MMNQLRVVQRSALSGILLCLGALACTDGSTTDDCRRASAECAQDFQCVEQANGEWGCEPRSDSDARSDGGDAQRNAPSDSGGPGRDDADRDADSDSTTAGDTGVDEADGRTTRSDAGADAGPRDVSVADAGGAAVQDAGEAPDPDAEPAAQACADVPLPLARCGEICVDLARDLAHCGACQNQCEPRHTCLDGACVPGITGNPRIDGVLLGDEARYNTEILRSQNPDLSWRPSNIYKWRDFVRAVETMYGSGVAGMRLWLGDEGLDLERQALYALVNLAAFLAQSMKETIQYDACDENNWDNTNEYQISNACGQLGQNYAEYDCEMACPRAHNMIASASTNAMWFGAPGPFFCAPDATLREAGLLTPNGRTGRWNHNSDCWPYPATEANFTPAEGQVWQRPECEVYTGQRGGQWIWDGSGGSVEGCCWWGRGVIQTTGRCNFGTLNHYLGQSHLDPAEFPPPARILYPEVNFCEDPGVICGSEAYPELKWIAGLFYWMSSVQSYDVDGWAYLEQLRLFVDGELRDDRFIDSVSGIVNRGCHNPPCETGPVDGVNDRRENFDAVLRAMGLRGD